MAAKKVKQVAEVKTVNPLVNGSFDEKAAREVLKLVKDRHIQIVDLKFNDMPGLWQHFSIPASELLEMDDIMRSIWVDGIGFDGSSIRGFQKIQESDMILIPDPATAIVDPVCEVPTLSIICDIYDPLTRKPYTRDPRYIAKRRRNTLKIQVSRTPFISGLRLNFSFLTACALTKTKIPLITILIQTRATGIQAGMKARIWDTRYVLKKDIFLSRPMIHCRI